MKPIYSLYTVRQLRLSVLILSDIFALFISDDSFSFLMFLRDVTNSSLLLANSSFTPSGFKNTSLFSFSLREDDSLRTFILQSNRSFLKKFPSLTTFLSEGKFWYLRSILLPCLFTFLPGSIPKYKNITYLCFLENSLVLPSLLVVHKTRASSYSCSCYSYYSCFLKEDFALYFGSFDDFVEN